MSRAERAAFVAVFAGPLVWVALMIAFLHPRGYDYDRALYHPSVVRVAEDDPAWPLVPGHHVRGYAFTPAFPALQALGDARAEAAE